MLDQFYIDELKSIENEKEAKAKLYDYAKTLNIRVYKKDTLDEMIEMFNKKVSDLKNEPLPDQPENGLTISDLIQADDELNGSIVLDEPEAKPEAIAALKGEAPIEIVIKPESDIRHIDMKIEIEKPVEEIETVEKHVEIKQTSNLYELPKNFSPTITLMGKNPGYCTLPWWIYEWILENPEWKSNPDKCHHYHAIETLKSLIYYIKRDGSVQIRETRNSTFVILD